MSIQRLAGRSTDALGSQAGRVYAGTWTTRTFGLLRRRRPTGIPTPEQAEDAAEEAVPAG